MSSRSRFLALLAGVLLAGAFAFPLWRISLEAPQYPEGIGMLIRVATVDGVKPNDLHNINGLNHYIGMRAIEPDAIPELRYMPWVLGALVAGAAVVALVGRRTALVAWLATFLAAGLAGLADFWKWGYDYGHELDPHAIIKIPGMVYQPPLVGSKQLLNFTAHSWPDVGGALAGLAFALGVLALLAGCAPRGPRAIAYDAEPCGFCRMVISDRRFGAEAMTATGRQHLFDSIECLASFVAAQAPRDVRGAWVSDWNHPGTFVAVDSADFRRLAGPAGSPMGKGFVATARGHAPDGVDAAGPVLRWSDVLAATRAEAHAEAHGEAHADARVATADVEHEPAHAR
ncbi:MAG: hypothetical protein JO180_11050 [Gemmatirosa sp.]|nr:hypothetical protein [Gemmatirosa sp.]